MTSLMTCFLVTRGGLAANYLTPCSGWRRIHRSRRGFTFPSI